MGAGAGVTAGCGQRRAKMVKCDTGADTSRAVLLTVEARLCQADPFQKAILSVVSLAPAGSQPASYLSVSVPAGEKVAPAGRKA